MATARSGDEKHVILPPGKVEDLDAFERDTIPGPPPAECEERDAPVSKRTDPHHETMPAPPASERKRSGTYPKQRTNLASTIAPPCSDEEIEPVNIPPLRTPRISVR